MKKYSRGSTAEYFVTGIRGLFCYKDTRLRSGVQYFANSISSWPSELLDGCSGAYSLLIPPKAPSSSRYSLPKRKTPTAVPAMVRVGGKIRELRIITLLHEIVVHELYNIHYRLDFLIPVSSIFNYPLPSYPHPSTQSRTECLSNFASIETGPSVTKEEPAPSIHDPSCRLSSGSPYHAVLVLR